MSDVAYWAVFVELPSERNVFVCAALFGEAEEALTEARARMAEGLAVGLEPGVMSTAEWDAFEEVPDDFEPQRPEARS